MSSIANVRPSFVSEQIADALRADDQARVAEISPYAACLMPLLSALGWRSYARDIIEALPHFSTHLELGELRNMLVILGYQSDAHSVYLPDIDANLLPCLFAPRSGGVYIIKDRRDGRFAYFDGQRRTHDSGLLRLHGTAYLFTETNALNAGSTEKDCFG